MTDFNHSSGASPAPRGHCAAGGPNQPRYRRGMLVRVLPAERIAKSLDRRGRHGGLPFMPEMRKYCGRTFTIKTCLNRICVEGRGFRPMERTVILEGATCDGAAHQGCQRLCPILWKDAWIEPAGPASTQPDAIEATGVASAPMAAEDDLPPCQGQAPILAEGTRPIHYLDPRQYLRDLVTGTLSPAELVRTVPGSLRHPLHVLRRDARRRFRRASPAGTAEPQAPPVPASLGLQAGEWVEVRSRAEIAATLDERDRNRGLIFMAEMWRYCGGRFRVLGRVDRMIVEPTGKMRAMKDTVLLDGVVCDPCSHLGCSRGCGLLWREAWLKRVT